jgi:hypothetical protein
VNGISSSSPFTAVTHLYYSFLFPSISLLLHLEALTAFKLRTEMLKSFVPLTLRQAALVAPNIGESVDRESFAELIQMTTDGLSQSSALSKYGGHVVLAARVDFVTLEVFVTN